MMHINVFSPIESYDYYDWDGLGPLAGALSRGLSSFLSAKGSTLLVLVLLAACFLYFTWRLPKKRRWLIALVLPVFVFDAFHSLQLIWVLPLYLLCLALLDKRPAVAGFVSTFGTLLGLHPLLSIFLIFFTKERKSYGIGAVTGALIGFLIPFLVYQPGLYLHTFGEWYMSFRSNMTPLADGVVSDYSFIGLLRHYTHLDERWVWLILVNFFHFLLLPCLRIGRSRKPHEKAPIFIGAVVTFIGVMSGLNSPFTLVLPLAGILLWALYSPLYPQWLLLICMIVVSLVSYGISFLVWIEPSLLQDRTTLLCIITISTVLPIHILQIIDLWVLRKKGQKK